nr:tigger transposable element-derived protein 6-like [Dermacentor andersoni]
MPPPAKKRKFITLQDKAEIIAQAGKGRKKMDIAEEFEIACSSISTILKNKASILGALGNGASAKNKTVSAAAFPDVDKAVFAWFCEQCANKVPLSGRVLQQKAQDFACILGHADFKASPGWLSRFKARHDIVAKVISGEAAAVDPLTTSSWLLTNKEVLDQYKPSDIYNADETALFYEMLPSKTLDLKGQECRGGKHSKRRVTILLCTNMDGTDQRPLLVIGRSKKPRCFKGNRRLPVQYTANLKAWMSRAIFGSWLEAFDTDMRKAGRSVCLFVDNCSAHHVDDVELGNVRLVFFPPNCTSVLQPLDQGVIRSVKCAYKERLIQRLLLNLQLKRPTVVDMFMALEMMAAAWVATSPGVIDNCFNHAGFIATRQASCADPVASQEDSPEGALVDSADGAVPPSLAHAWDELSAVTDGVPDGLSIDEFLCVDEGVVVHEEVTDEVIISSVCQGADDHQTPNQERTANPRDLLNAFDVIRSFFEKEQQAWPKLKGDSVKLQFAVMQGSPIKRPR